MIVRDLPSTVFVTAGRDLIAAHEGMQDKMDSLAMVES
jgi:hypothetical protein